MCSATKLSEKSGGNKNVNLGRPSSAEPDVVRAMHESLNRMFATGLGGYHEARHDPGSAFQRVPRSLRVCVFASVRYGDWHTQKASLAFGKAAQTPSESSCKRPTQNVVPWLRLHVLCSPLSLLPLLPHPALALTWPGLRNGAHFPTLLPCTAESSCGFTKM